MIRFGSARGYYWLPESSRNSRSSRPTRWREDRAFLALVRFEAISKHIHAPCFPGGPRSPPESAAHAPRGIYLLPALLTVSNMVCGFYGRSCPPGRPNLSPPTLRHRPQQARARSPSCSTSFDGLWLVRTGTAVNSVNSLITLPDIGELRYCSGRPPPAPPPGRPPAPPPPPPPRATPAHGVHLAASEEILCP